MTRDELYNFWRFEETFPFSGWDFAHLDGRWEQEPLPWDFYAEVQRRLHYADQLLEVDTGGAFLLSLRHPYENTPPRKPGGRMWKATATSLHRSAFMWRNATPQRNRCRLQTMRLMLRFAAMAHTAPTSCFAC